MTAERRAFVRFEADDSRLKKGLDRTKKGLASFAKGLAGKFRGAFSDITSLAGIGDGIGFAVVGKQVLDFETNLTRLGIASGATQGELNGWRQKVDDISTATGIAREEVLAGGAAFQAMTGDARASQQLMAVFARTAQASGAQVNDVAAAAAALQSVMRIDASDMEQAMSIVLAGGKAGSIELKDMAGLLGGVSAQFVKFGESGNAGLARLNAAFQTISPEFGFSGEEAQTGLRAYMDTLEKNAKRIKKLTGVNPKDKKGKMRSLRELAPEFAAAEKKGKNLFQAFGRTESVRTQRALGANLEKWDQIYEASKNAKDVAKDYATFQESSAGKLASATNKAKLALVGLFTPERIEQFAEAMGKVSQAIIFMADHAKEVALIFGGLKVGGGLVGAFAGTAGQLGGFATKLGVAAGALSVMTGALLLAIDMLEAKQEKDIEDSTEAKRATDAIGKGRITQSEELIKKHGLIDPKSGQVRKDRLKKIVDEADPDKGRKDMLKAQGRVDAFGDLLTNAQVDILAIKLAQSHEKAMAKAMGQQQPAINVTADGEKLRTSRVR